MTPALLSLALTVAAPIPRDAKKDPPPIVGQWAAESALKGGKPDNPPPGTTWTFTVDGKSVLAVGGGEGTTESTYTVDPKKSPAWVDVAAGPKDRPFKGVYKVDGNTLTLALIDGDGERPAAFESPAGSRVIVITLKRITKKD